jgi:hypothetical protein
MKTAKALGLTFPLTLLGRCGDRIGTPAAAASSTSATGRHLKTFTEADGSAGLSVTWLIGFVGRT